MNHQWFHCEIIFNLLNEEKRVVGEVDLGNGQRARILNIGLKYLACAFSRDLPNDLAIAQVRKYLKKNNPELKDNDFSLTFYDSGHNMCGQLSNEKILFVTEKGCTLGPPK